MEILGIDVKLSSAFHPQTDGQTKRVNHVLEQYLRCTIAYQQDDWAELLPLAEFSYNNSVHASTGFTPFFVNYGIHPQFDLKKPTDIIVPSAEDHANQMLDLHCLLRATLEQVQQYHKESAD